MSSSKKSYKYVCLGIIILIVLLFFLLVQFFVIPSVDPSAYSLNISSQNANMIEDEFLFSIPEGASIEFVTYTTGLGRGNIARCGIKGTFTPREFMDNYSHFKIGSKINEYDQYFKISGFPTIREDKDATIEFTESAGQTTVIILKSGIRNKNLQINMDKIETKKPWTEAATTGTF